MDPFIGELKIFGFNWAPRGWAFCAGQLMSIAANTALFSLLGTTYGGDGVTTFGLPDLRGRAYLNQGNGPGLSPYVLGQVSGEEAHMLINTEMATHNHLVAAAKDFTVTSPANAFLANDSRGLLSIYNTTKDTQMNPQMTGLAGGSQPHNNIQPSLVLNICIALNGIFPSRN